MTKQVLFDGDTFEHKGRTFRVEFPFDEFGRVPWEDCDGHGIVSDWTTRDKKPGERVLATDRSLRRYYDYAETIKIALRDGWDAEPIKTGTKRQQAERAVNADFEYLRRWCNDAWQYVGVIVKHEDSGESESIWGIESDSTDYLAETAHELADEICFRLDEAMARDIAESRPDMYGKETAS
jgi:hypothetical protein